MRLICDTFRWLTTTASERGYIDDCQSRPQLSDQEFYEQFYADSGISLEICIGVRRVLFEQLRMCNVRPNDDLGTIFDIDLYEIFLEVGEELEVTFPEVLLDKTDGTVDSLIRVTDELMGGQHPTTP